jgi:cobalt-zinc-cadmium efflux system membrane fusion protein
MTQTLQMGRGPLVLVIVGCLAAGSLVTYFVVNRQPVGPTAASTPTVEPSQPTVNGATGDTVVTLTPEAAARAGIESATVTTSTGGGRLRIPAIVQPNAYRTVVVTPVVAGRITRVPVELGQRVQHGQTLAEIYSPELADAQTQYVSAKAELDAHERELRRTEKLVEIGSASRQELEKIHAEHTAAESMLQSRRSRLTLLGMTESQLTNLSSSSQVASTVHVPAPIDGVITVRAANIGLNVDPSAPLFTVVDLSNVWLVGDLYERDLGRVRIGSAASATTNAFPELRVEGKVSYIDPEIKADARTAQVRVEVPNPGRQLRLGMYVDMEVGEPGGVSGVMIPRAALQMVGDRTVVYLANPTIPGQYIEREVKLGEASGDAVQVISGVVAGDNIVSKGSFSVRAERDRVGARASTPTGSGAVQPTRVIVSEKGFDPARVSLRAGAPARLTFVRTSDATCATEVVIPSLNIKRSLPLNQPVNIEFTPNKAGDVAFACGMGMFSGTIVVR